MTRFNQCYEAGLHLGAKKIVFHSGMNPYVYYKEYWAEQVAKFWQEFMKNKTELEVVLENVFDDDWRLLLDVYERVNQPNFKLCLDIGHAHCYSCKSCPHPRQLRRPGFPHRAWKRKPSLGGSAWLSAGNKRTYLDHWVHAKRGHKKMPWQPGWKISCGTALLINCFISSGEYGNYDEMRDKPPIVWIFGTMLPGGFWFTATYKTPRHRL